MKKIDFKKDFKQLYQAPRDDIAVVQVPEAGFLMLDGRGDPATSQDFQDSFQVLYGTAYTVKFTLKKAAVGPEYTMPPPECLWWMEREFDPRDKEKWQWTLMLMQPPHITEAHVMEAVEELQRKKPHKLLPTLRLARFCEGISAQMLHVGPYEACKPTIEKMHRLIRERGYELAGRHHEIYLSDPRRSAPEKLKTIMRNPVKG